ncbi:hypothetical protein [Ferrimonas pelagia]|uniref:hypothetical protein n=1 Tax=Ferrimonas pelagia TaxID=1177826 RepID=UPI0031F0D292
MQGRARHQRWLHPRQLPYFWVSLLCLLTAPAVALGLLVYFGVVLLTRRWRSDPAH